MGWHNFKKETVGPGRKLKRRHLAHLAKKRNAEEEGAGKKRSRGKNLTGGNLFLLSGPKGRRES